MARCARPQWQALFLKNSCLPQVFVLNRLSRRLRKNANAHRNSLWQKIKNYFKNTLEILHHLLYIQEVT